MKVIVNANLLRAAAKCTSTDGSRGSLCCVKIEAERGYYKITATDSYEIVQFEEISSDQEIEPGFVLIDSDFIKSNIKSSDKLAIIESYDSETSITCLGENNGTTKELKFVNQDYRFPDCKSLFNGFWEKNIICGEALFSPSEAETIIKCVKTAFGKHKKLSVKQSENMFEFMTVENSVTFMALLMKCKK